MMTRRTALLTASGALATLTRPDAEGAELVGETPGNQVFQFMQSGSFSGWADGATTKATAYLWIPEKCERLRGLLVMGANVPEHMLVGNRTIRDVCAANNLGIVWSTPTFWYYKSKNEDKSVVAFLQQLLDGLAETSGYKEVAVVPWLPMGESGHLLMVDALVEAAPERCIAAIWMKNPHLPPHNRTMPALVVFGSAQEWTQDKADLRTRWNDMTPYDKIAKQKAENPDWPLSFTMDGGSGHFDVSEKLVRYFARYIDLAAKARVPQNASASLKPVALPKGVMSEIFPKAEAPVKFWFFDRESAAEARAIADINWKAETQLPGFMDAKGNIAPFNFNGISSLTPEMEADGITFRLRGVMLEKLPENFVDGGQPLPHAPGTPKMEWLCGYVTPLGGDRFRVALDRTYPSHAIYLAARQPGTATIREAVQPIGIKLQKNTTGKAQTITFEPLRDVTVHTRSIQLVAKSDSGLPVSFFVVAGPAMVQDGKLVFTKIPPRTQFPVSVTVAAWQWGRSQQPSIKAAAIVKQTLRIAYQ